MSKTVLFQTIKFSITTVFVCTQWNGKTVNFKQLSLALVNSLVLFDPKIGPSQVLPLRDRVDWRKEGNEGVLCILQISRITEASPSDWLASYRDPHLGKSAEMQSICIDYILQSQLIGQKSVRSCLDPIHWSNISVWKLFELRILDI